MTDPDQLRRKTLVGATWMMGMWFAVRVLGIASTIVLARLLTPSDFGIVSLAGSAYFFFQVIGQFGFESALIRLRNAEKAHYDTAWTANILVAGCIALSMLAIGYPAALFFKDPRIENVVYAFAILSLAKGFENIGVVNFRKELAFRGDFLYFVLPKCVSVATGLVAAYVLRNYWALIIGMIAYQVTALLYSHFSQPLRPRFALSKFRELFQYSRWIVARNVLQYASTNGLDATLGRMRDAATVGVFQLARELAEMVSVDLFAPLNRALFSSAATIANDRSRLHGAFTKIFSVTALFAVPAAFGLFALAEPLVYVAFGEQWTDAVPILAVVCFAGSIGALHCTTHGILLAVGKPNVIATAYAARGAVALPLSIALIPTFGAVGVAHALLLAEVAASLILYRALASHLATGALPLLLAAGWRPLTGAVLMLVFMNRAGMSPAGSEATVMSLLEAVASGAAVYAASVLALWLVAGRPPGAERELLALLPRPRAAH